MQAERQMVAPMRDREGTAQQAGQDGPGGHMSQFLFYALFGTALVLGYRLLKRAHDERPTLRPAPVPIDPVRLERGPDGIFRPVDRR